MKIGFIRFSKPDSIKNPKTRLIKVFTLELGTGRRYVDYQHAIMIAKEIPDYNRIRQSHSFKSCTESVFPEATLGNCADTGSSIPFTRKFGRR